MPNVYIGLDIGTSSAKAVVMDETGKVVTSSSVEYPVSYPKPGWSEQDPHEWWKATLMLLEQVKTISALPAGDFKGIGLSGQMHGSVFLDAQGNVIRPALLWNDQRTVQECQQIEELAGGRDELIKLVANPALTGFTAPKILWLRNHEPENYEKVHKILLPKDYVRYRLTGEFATEVSDASGTLLLDISKRDWSTALLEKLDLDRQLLPDCFESPEVSGKLAASVAEQVGLPVGTPVVGGAGDQAAGAVGSGIVKTGVISATMGTSGVVFAHSDEMAFDPAGRLHTFCHAVPGKWHQMGVVLSAGGSLQWFRDQLSQQEVEQAKSQGVDPYELISALAQGVPAGSEGLYFLPYLTGERTPHADPHARGAWIGLSPRHTRGHLARAVMEGATYAMRDSLELIRGLGVPIEQIRITGGGARGAFWRQLQANIYGQDVVPLRASEGPAMGVAILAAVGTGAFSSVEEACEATVVLGEKTACQPKTVEFYNGGYPIFKKLYQSLKNDFASLSPVDSTEAD